MNNPLGASTIKTALDKVIYQEFEPEKLIGLATAETSAIFNQVPITKSAQIEEVFGGSGYWETRGELENVPAGQSKVSNQMTFSVVNFAKSEDISKNYFDDEQWNVVTNIVKMMAMNGKQTRNRAAFEIWRGAFAATLTADGSYLCSDSHALMNSGLTVDNYLTAKLAESSLNDAIVSLGQQKSQDGVVMGLNAKTLLVPLARYKLACEITDSDLKSQTANNDVNVYSSKYGIQVFQSPFLGTAVSASAGNNQTITAGSNDYWFLLGSFHQVNRYKRQDIVTDLVDYKFSRNNNYVYKAEFREVYGAPDYLGVVGSDGTTGTYA